MSLRVSLCSWVQASYGKIDSTVVDRGKVVALCVCVCVSSCLFSTTVWKEGGEISLFYSLTISIDGNNTNLLQLVIIYKLLISYENHTISVLRIFVFFCILSFWSSDSWDLVTLGFKNLLKSHMRNSKISGVHSFLLIIPERLYTILD